MPKSLFENFVERQVNCAPESSMETWESNTIEFSFLPPQGWIQLEVREGRPKERAQTVQWKVSAPKAQKRFETPG